MESSRVPKTVTAGLLLAAILVAGGWGTAGCRPERPSAVHQPNSTASTNSPPPSTAATRPGVAVPTIPTFHRDIAPLVHEPALLSSEGQPGPFNLIAYPDVARRTNQILKVISSGFMPPWLPVEGSAPFADARTLSTPQKDLIRQWVEVGAPEGNPAEARPPKLLASGWQLGKLDLVVRMPEPYLLPADGPDTYRNFVIPLPLDSRRYVRALEFQPGTRVIHHAFILLDPTRQSRRLDARDPEPGFGGAAVPPVVESPGGYFLSWQPGRRPVESPPGLAWPLKPGYDVVLQLHMQPSGKVEPVQPSIGFYFTDQVPTNSPLKISLSSYDIDIAPGNSSYTISDRFVLPTEATLLSLLPHAHFLARTMEGYAVLPSGQREPLLHIRDWDFNWQSDYRLAHPLFLPAGTELVMRYTYDNSTNNVRNPAHPPVRVLYGPQTRDEMGELWLQLLPANSKDQDTLQNAYQQRLVTDALKYNSLLISREPTNAHAHVQLGKARYALGEVDKAAELLRQAIALDPRDEEAHYNLGVIHLQAGRLQSANREFTRTLDLNPENSGALNNLGLIRLQAKQYDDAEALFRKVLRINPDADFARANLKLVADERAQAGK